MWVIVRDTPEELVYREIGKIVAIYRMEGGDHFLKVADRAPHNILEDFCLDRFADRDPAAVETVDSVTYEGNDYAYGDLVEMTFQLRKFPWGCEKWLLTMQHRYGDYFEVLEDHMRAASTDYYYPL
jgi:hypothetical protein